MTLPIDLVLDRLESARRSGDTGRQWTACCPAHDDARQSLSVGVDKDGKILLWCHAGCETAAVVSALGLTFADLTPDSARRNVLPFHRTTKKKQKDDSSSKTPQELDALLRKCEADPGCVIGVRRYADHLSLPFQLLWDLGCRWKRIEIYPPNPNDPGELWYPERDGSGKTIGIGIRSWDGSKCSVAGSHRGLIIHPNVIKNVGPIYLVDGMTDTVVLLSLGLCVVGRPSNTGGVAHLAKFLSSVFAGREIIVVGENDKKLNGEWPGRGGAECTSQELSALLKRSVKVALPPEPFKDSREWHRSFSIAGSKPSGEVYQSSLVFCGAFSTQIQEVTESELIAAAIPISSESAYAYPDEMCPCPRHVLLKKTSDHKLRHSLVRCGASSCSCCFKRKKRLRYESLCRHFDAEKLKRGSLHCSVKSLSKQEWATIRRGIKRRGGNFVCFRHIEELFVIIATLPFTNSEPLPFEQAAEFTKNAIDQAVVAGKGKPFFSSSTEWAMVREAKPSLYENLGIIKMPPQSVKNLCQKHLGRGNYHQKRYADSNLLLDGFINYAAPDPDNDEFVQMLLAKQGVSELLIPLTHDSDNFPPAEYGIRRLPPDWDEWFAGWLNPTA